MNKRTFIGFSALLLLGTFSSGWAQETVGNNLSFPVIWSDGVSKNLQGTYGDPVFGDDCIELDGTCWYEQQDPDNLWQAESYIAEGNKGPFDVTWIDWGDNLEAKSWSENAVVRVETVLYYDLPGEQTMLGFEMMHLDGQGIDEMWGTNKKTYESKQANVYSACARLTIQKLLKSRDDETLLVQWDSGTAQWSGDINPPIFNSGAWEAEEGASSPDFYSAEINIAGKVIYGYNWRVIKAEGPGDYRITFSLADSDVCPHTLNTTFDTTQVLLPDEEDLSAMSDDGSEDSDLGGGTAVVDHDNNLSYIDVRITPRESGAGNGNQGQGGQGSQGGNAGGKGERGK